MPSHPFIVPARAGYAPLLRQAAPDLVLGLLALPCAAAASRHGADLAVMAAVALASVASSIAGFAFSAICGAMLFHLSDDRVRMVQLMIACSIANQAAMVWALRGEMRLSGFGVFLAGGAIGLPLGVLALLRADRVLYMHALGVLLLAYGAYMLVRRPGTVAPQHPCADLAVGILGGITGGAAGFPGAFVTIWCGLKGWSKERQRAVFQPFILVMQVAALVAISILRPRAGGTAGFDAAMLLFVPAGLLGTRLGMAWFRRLSNRQFATAVNLLLMISGAGFVL